MGSRPDRRVLSTSTSSVAGANAFPSLWLEAVEGAGVEVVPFSRRAALHGRYDAVHVHWPETTFGRIGSRPRRAAEVVANLAVLVLLKARGTRILWTVHNVRPHAGVDLASRWSLRAFTRLVDEYLVMSESAAEELGVRSRPSRWRLVRHPVYPVASAASAPPGSHRFVSFGEVRPYRGYLELVDRFRSMPASWHLHIVGAGRHDEYAARLRALVDGDDRVEWTDARLTDAELEEAILAADAVVLWYQRVTNSGAALMALSLGRPVVVPGTGAFQELRDEVGGEWVYLVQESLETALVSATAPKTAPPDLSRRSWDVLAETVRAAVGGAR